MTDSSVLKFSLSAQDFDASQLPAAARTPGTPAFREAVKHYLREEFSRLGGWNDVQVDDRTINVRWTPDRAAPDPLEQILAKLQRGENAGAITLLQLLLSDSPESFPILYNLGMALSDAGRLDEAEHHLRRALAVDPGSANTRVALGVALQRQGKSAEAVDELREAIRTDPNNPWAHRNLGACLANAGRLREGEQCFRRATELNPRDQTAWLGLAQALERLGEVENADEAYRKVIDVDEYSDVAEMARDALRRIAQSTFRERGGGLERPDAVMYCLGALERFEKMAPAEVQRIAFEIAALGQRGLDVNDPASKYTLKSLPGSFSGLHLVSMMYVAFKQIAPGQDIGFDLSREYEAAQSLHAGQRQG